MIIQYIIVIYGKIPPSQLINLKQKTKEMHYNPQTPIDTVINQVKDLLEYGELAGYLYIHIQTKKIAYTIINKTRKFQDSINTWNRMNPIKQFWTDFENHLRTASASPKKQVT